MGKNAEGAGSREEGEGTKEGGVCSFNWRKLKGKVFGNVSAAQGAVTQKRTLWGRGALEPGHGVSPPGCQAAPTPFERLAQLGDSLGGVGPLFVLHAAQLLIAQTAKGIR